MKMYLKQTRGAKKINYAPRCTRQCPGERKMSNESSILPGTGNTEPSDGEREHHHRENPGLGNAGPQPAIGSSHQNG